MTVLFYVIAESTFAPSHNYGIIIKAIYTQPLVHMYNVPHSSSASTALPTKLPATNLAFTQFLWLTENRTRHSKY